MLAIVGALIVIASVFGGYALAGGHLEILWQPFEVIIICGAALGAFVISNSMKIITGAFTAPIKLLKGEKFKKEGYLELLGLMFTIFKLAYIQGYAPAICVEFARKTIYSNNRPTFYEVEDAMDSLPAPSSGGS